MRPYQSLCRWFVGSNLNAATQTGELFGAYSWRGSITRDYWKTSVLYRSSGVRDRWSMRACAYVWAHVTRKRTGSWIHLVYAGRVLCRMVFCLDEVVVVLLCFVFSCSQKAAVEAPRPLIWKPSLTPSHTSVRHTTGEAAPQVSSDPDVKEPGR